MGSGSATNCASPAASGSAHLGWTFPEFDRVAGINDGYVLLAPSSDVAASLLSTPGYVTAAFVVPRPGADITPTSTASSPASRPQGRPGRTCPPCSRTACRVSTSSRWRHHRRRPHRCEHDPAGRRGSARGDGTIGAIGAKPFGLFGGMLGEGAVVGRPRGTVGCSKRLPARDVSGEQIRAIHVGRVRRRHHSAFHAGLIAIGAVAGDPLRNPRDDRAGLRLVRDGPLASMASVGECSAPGYPDVAALVGVGLLAGAVVVLKIFERGSLPLNVGINGLTVALSGGVGDGVDRSAWRRSPIDVADARPSRRRAAAGADFRRYALLFAMSAALLAESTSLAIGSHSMQLLGTEQVAAQKTDRLPPRC